MSPTEQALTEIWSDLLAVEHVRLQDAFFDLGGHSLLAVRLMARIERQLGVKLPLAAVFRGPTIETLAEAIDRRQPPAGSPLLVPIRPARSAARQPRPFFLVHPIGGHVLCYADLARHLDADRAVHGLQAQGHDGTESFHPDVPSMAAAYIEAIRTAQPHGPYLLAGWSMGGLVAYEMARQLAAGGEQVELLAIIDCAPRNASCLADGSEALRVFARDLGLTPEATAGVEAAGGVETAGLEQVLKSGQRARILDPDLDLDRLRQLYRVFANNDRAMSQYRPLPYPGSGTLFLPSGNASEGDAAITEVSPAAGDPTLGWAELAAEIEVLAVSGDHFSMVREPHVRTLAKQLELAARRKA